MTLRILIAITMLVCGPILFFAGINSIAGSEIAMALMTFVVSVMVAAGGIYCCGAGIVILAHSQHFKRFFND